MDRHQELQVGGPCACEAAWPIAAPHIQHLVGPMESIPLSWHIRPAPCHAAALLPNPDCHVHADASHADQFRRFSKNHTRFSEDQFARINASLATLSHMEQQKSQQKSQQTPPWARAHLLHLSLYMWAQGCTGLHYVQMPSYTSCEPLRHSRCSSVGARASAWTQ